MTHACLGIVDLYLQTRIFRSSVHYHSYLFEEGRTSKVLNDSTLLLNESESPPWSFKINFGSFRAFRGPLFFKQIMDRELLFGSTLHYASSRHLAQQRKFHTEEMFIDTMYEFIKDAQSCKQSKNITIQSIDKSVVFWCFYTNMPDHSTSSHQSYRTKKLHYKDYMKPHVASL